MAQWTADISVDAALAATLITSQFPELALTVVEPFGHGWDNAAFLADGRLIFRFPRRRIAAGLIEREAAILPLIASLLPIRISVPHLIGTPTAVYPWTFAGYAAIEGTWACSQRFSDTSRAALAKPLADFLRALHDIEPLPLLERGLPPDRIGRLDHAKRTKLIRECLPLLVRSGFIAADDALIAWLVHPPITLNDNQRRLVHGDLYAQHVLLDALGKLAGIIDWGDVHLGDPAIDIAKTTSRLAQ